VRWREQNEEAPGGVPVRLRRFDPEDWPGADVRAKHEAWLAARESWEVEHGEWVESLTELLESFEGLPDAPWDQDAI
jgi:hypothetical protein